LPRTATVGLLVGAALLWSLGGLLIKLAQWHPLGIASVRSGIAALTIALILRIQHRRWPHLVPKSTATWGAALGYAGTVILFVQATKLTAAANAIVLQYTAPLYVAIGGSMFLGERLRASEWVLLGLMLSGTALFFAEHLSSSGMVGNLAGIGSGIAMASMTLCLRCARDQSALEALVTGNIIAAISGVWLWTELPDLDGRTVGVLAVLGVVQLGIPYVLFAHALRRARAIEAIMLTMLEPIVNPLWVMLAIGERPTGYALLGGALVVGSTIARAVLSYARSSVDVSSGSSVSSGGTSS
jgi:drug/metabolite transporter (DMT)-like permease